MAGAAPRLPPGNGVASAWLQTALAAGVFCVVAAVAPAVHGQPVVEVGIEKEQFIPRHLKVKRGTTVRWVNNEKRTSHSVWFQQAGLPESERLLPQDSWERRFDVAGTYPYVCGPHPEMTGVVEVTD